MGSNVMDQAPKGGNLALVRLARGIGLLTLGGYVVLVLFIFGVIDADAAAPIMTLAAGFKLVHESIMSFVRYRLGTAFLHITSYDVVVSSLAGALLLSAVALQLWGDSSPPTPP